MHSTCHNRHIFSLVGCCLIFLLMACNSNMPPTTVPKGTPRTPGITPPISRGITPISTATTTVAMPSTQISCPPEGTARGMVTAPLALGSHQNIIYTLNQGTYDAPTHAKLIRYDVQTGRKAELLNVNKAHIYEAQVSADGQWVLFVTTTGSVGRQSKLQMLRLDGQGLQTLYCAPDFGIQQILWSTDQHLLVFYNVVNEQGVVYLLNMTGGALQAEFSPPLGTGIVLRTWLDATHVYLTDTSVDTIHARIYLLDINKGPHQHFGNLLTVLLQNYGDFDSSDDGSQLFVSHGGCPQGVCSGPSSITKQSIAGSSRQTIYDSQVYDVIAVRTIDHNSLLFIIGNTSTIFGTDVDRSHNGLWKINVDGSGMTRLISITAQQYCFLNYNDQEPWANVSRDGSMYVLQVNGFEEGIVEKDSLLVGSVDGGKPKVFATIADGSQLVMAGWTVM